MNLGIIICTYNRPNLLKQCLDSIIASDVPEGTQFIIVDDGSTDPGVMKSVVVFEQFFKTVFIHKSNKGIHDSLFIGFEYAFAHGCDVVMNLDSDAIVKPDWITRILALHTGMPHTIVSGFNTLSCDHETKKPRHPVANKFSNFVEKKSIGGINMCFNKKVYDLFVRHHLKPNWDWLVCHSFPYHFVVTKPSVVQHIGMSGMHNINPDVAIDF